MRAYVLASEGGSPSFQEVAAPTPAREEVLVRVIASSVTPHDAGVASGAAARYMRYHYPVILGSDIAGVVEAVGSEVSGLAAGDRVFGLVRERDASRGSFAELVAVPQDWLAPTPPGLEDTEAGALGLAALTALRCVEATEPTEGETVLIVGATGGVGTYVAQLVSARGATVIGTARPGEEADHVRRAGANHVVDWSQPDMVGQVRTAAPDGVDVIGDLVGPSPDALAALVGGVLREGGRVASTRHAADPERTPGGRATNLLVAVDAEAMSAIATLAADGTLRAPVTRSFSVGDVAAAFSALQEGALGKIGVHIGDPSPPGRPAPATHATTPDHHDAASAEEHS